MRDLNQLNQTVTAYKTNRVGSTVGAAYAEANAYDPKTGGYADTLNKAGFTAARYGQGEFDARMNLLAGIDAADTRIANRPAVMEGGGGYGGYWGMQSGGRGIGSDPRNVAERALLAQQRRDVLNPTISLSSIKVPGMPGMAPGTPTNQTITGNQTIWGGGVVTGGGIVKAPVTQYTPPSQLQGPSITGQPMGGPGIPGPSTAAPPPTYTPPPVPPPAVVPPATVATLPGMPKGYTGPKTGGGQNRVIY
jgi:hypothetical protein